jgi:hypothetical protein
MLPEVIMKHFVMVNLLVIVNEKMLYKNVSINYMMDESGSWAVLTDSMVVVVAQSIHLSYGIGEEDSGKHVQVCINSAVVLQIVL